MLIEKLRTAVNIIERLEESAYNPSTGKLKLTIIQSGFNKGKGRFYPASTLARDFKVFENAKMFADHQTDQEIRTRPEGSVNNWVGQITNVRWDVVSQKVVGEAAVIDPPFKAKLEELSKQGLLKEMGVSIRAVGIGAPSKIDGVETNNVEALTHARSVDFVTYPGAGGQVEAIESALDENDVTLISLSELRARRPDLVELLESSTKEQSMTPQEQVDFDALKAKVAVLETAKTTAETATTTLATENQQLKAAAAKAGRVAEAQPKIAAAIKEANLPEPAAARLTKQFISAETIDGVKEAITAEQEYLKAVKAPAKVTNLGGGGNDQQESVKPEEIVASFMRLGMTEAQAKDAANQ